MSTTRFRRTAATVAALAAAGTTATAVASSTAQAQPPTQPPTPAPSRISVHASDTTPAAGQQFVLSGAVWSRGTRVPATVRVKLLTGGTWRQLPGAVQQTNRNDRYRLRIVLDLKGMRQLKVVGMPRGPAIARAATILPVTVH